MRPLCWDQKDRDAGSRAGHRRARRPLGHAGTASMGRGWGGSGEQHPGRGLSREGLSSTEGEGQWKPQGAADRRSPRSPPARLQDCAGSRFLFCALVSTPPPTLPQYAQARSKVPQHTAASCWWHLGEMRAEGWQQSGEGRGEERRRPRAGSSEGWASRRTRRGMARDKPPFRKKSRKASVKIGEASPEDDAGNNHCYSLSSECRSPWIQLSTLGSVRRELSGMLLGKPPPQAVG